MKIRFLQSAIMAIIALSTFASSSYAAAKARQTINVILDEMSLHVEGQDKKSPLVLKAGQPYKIVFENRGLVTHEVLMGRGVQEVEGEPGEFEYAEGLLSNIKVMVTAAWKTENDKKIFYAVTNGIEEIELDSSVRMAILFTLPDEARGVWELGCFKPGHYQMGMKLPLIVE